MTTETATAEAFARSLRHRHGLDNLAGFIVGEIDLRAAGGPAYRRDVAAFPGDTRYAAALEYARERISEARDAGDLGSLYGVLNVYSCGCTDRGETDGLDRLNV